MSNIFQEVKEYRAQVLEALKLSNKHYSSTLVEYSTPSKNYNIKYYKWNHPYQGTWEYQEIFTDEILNYVKNTIKPDSVVLDVGAQVGLMSVLYGQFAKKVIAFEPNPAVFEVLEKNSEVYPNMVPYNFACSNVEGPLEFHYSDEGFCNGGFASGCEKGIGVTGHTIPMDVYAVNLNDFMNIYHADDIDKISLIKIDTEGHDKEILKTIGDIINKVKPILITEMYSGLTALEITDLINTIHDYSYEIYDMVKDNSGMGIISHRKKINSVKDVVVGELCNFLCFPK